MAKLLAMLVFHLASVGFKVNIPSFRDDCALEISKFYLSLASSYSKSPFSFQFSLIYNLYYYLEIVQEAGGSYY